MNSINYKKYEVWNLYIIFDLSVSYGPETGMKTLKISHTKPFYNQSKLLSLLNHAQQGRRKPYGLCGTREISTHVEFRTPNFNGILQRFRTFPTPCIN